MNKLIIGSCMVLATVLYASRNNQNGLITLWERPTVQFPADNPLTDESIELGGALFFEPLFSKDTSISCQSCHLLTEAFADHLPLGQGIQNRRVSRNTPTLFNIGFHPYFMIDGKFMTLEEQVLGPINEHKEFDMSPELVLERLKTVPFYNEMSQKAYGKALSVDVVVKSLANFERVMISDNSKFDQFMRGEAELTLQEMAGWTLFKSPELNCIKCHGGYNFTNYAFENNGLLSVYQDSGRALVTKKESDLFKFKVPTLRNIAITYPYMHDGSFATLEDVIDHYAAGGKKHFAQSKLIQGFELNLEARKALLAFLNALTEERLRARN